MCWLSHTKKWKKLSLSFREIYFYKWEVAYDPCHDCTWCPTPIYLFLANISLDDFGGETLILCVITLVVGYHWYYYCNYYYYYYNYDYNWISGGQPFSSTEGEFASLSSICGVRVVVVVAFPVSSTFENSVLILNSGKEFSLSPESHFLELYKQFLDVILK